jgi:hypothetical protein
VQHVPVLIPGRRYQLTSGRRDGHNATSNADNADIGNADARNNKLSLLLGRV